MSAAAQESRESAEGEGRCHHPPSLEVGNGGNHNNNNNDYGFLSGLMTPQSLEQFAALRGEAVERIEKLREKGAEALEEIEAGFSEVCTHSSRGRFT